MIKSLIYLYRALTVCWNAMQHFWVILHRCNKRMKWHRHRFPSLFLSVWIVTLASHLSVLPAHWIVISSNIVRHFLTQIHTLDREGEFKGHFIWLWRLIFISFSDHSWNFDPLLDLFKFSLLIVRNWLTLHFSTLKDCCRIHQIHWGKSHLSF